MHFKNREISLIGITVALIVVLGFIFYFSSYILPLPGSKFIMMAPFLAFMYTIPLVKINKKGVILVISLLFAVMMSFITIIMGIAILSAGILTEITFNFLKKYKKKDQIIFSTPFFPLYSFLSFILLSELILGHQLINKISGLIFIIMGIVIYALGILGSKAAIKLNKKISFVK